MICMPLPPRVCEPSGQRHRAGLRRSRRGRIASGGSSLRPGRPGRAGRRRGGSPPPSRRTAERPGCRHDRTRRSGTASRCRAGTPRCRSRCRPGRTDRARAGSVMNDSARVSAILTVARGLVRLAAQLGELQRPLPGARVGQDLLGILRARAAAHPATSRISPPASAAAWQQRAQVARRLRRPRTTRPRSRPSPTALAKPSARRIAVASSAHPATGFHRNVDGTPPIPCGLNTSTGPRRERMPLVSWNTSAFVVVLTTGPR